MQDEKKSLKVVFRAIVHFSSDLGSSGAASLNTFLILAFFSSFLTPVHHTTVFTIPPAPYSGHTTATTLQSSHCHHHIIVFTLSPPHYSRHNTTTTLQSSHYRHHTTAGKMSHDDRKLSHVAGKVSHGARKCPIVPGRCSMVL